MCNEQDCGEMFFSDFAELQKHWELDCKTVVLECQRCEESAQRCDIKYHDCFDSILRAKKTLEHQNAELNARLVADDDDGSLLVD